MAKQTEPNRFFNGMFFIPTTLRKKWWINMGFFILLSGFQTPEVPRKGDIVLAFDNLKSQKGKVLILLFSSKDGFPEDARKSSYSANIDPTKLHTIKDIPFGKYALALVHDEDNNGKMNLNFLGIPKEGYSFSNSKGHGLERPNYQKAEFEHLNAETRMRVRFIY